MLALPLVLLYEAGIIAARLLVRKLPEAEAEENGEAAS